MPKYERGLFDSFKAMTAYSQWGSDGTCGHVRKTITVKIGGTVKELEQGKANVYKYSRTPLMTH